MRHVIAVEAGSPAVRAMGIAVLVTAVVLGAIAAVMWAWPDAEEISGPSRTNAHVQSSTAAEHGVVPAPVAAPVPTVPPTPPASAAVAVGAPTATAVPTPVPATATAPPATADTTHDVAVSAIPEPTRSSGDEPIHPLTDAMVAAAQFQAGERITAPVGTAFAVGEHTYVVDYDHWASHTNG